MDSVAEELLANVPKGEELRDPREGRYENAILKEVKLNDSGDAAVLTFTGLVNSEGQPFEYDHRVAFPTRQSEDWMKRMFLATLHDLEVVPREDKSARYVETPEAVAAVLEAFKSLIGIGFSVTLKESNSGFMNLRFNRRKK